MRQYTIPPNPMPQPKLDAFCLAFLEKFPYPWSREGNQSWMLLDWDNGLWVYIAADLPIIHFGARLQNPSAPSVLWKYHRHRATSLWIQTATRHDIAIIREVDAATDGLLLRDATNANDKILISWLIDTPSEDINELR